MKILTCLIQSCLILLLISGLFGCGGSQITANKIPYYDPQEAHTYNPTPAPVYSVKSGQTLVYAQNVSIRMDKDISVGTSSMAGELLPKKQGEPLYFDDIKSYVINVHKAKLTIDSTNLNTLMNNYVLNYANCPLKNIEVTFLSNRLRICGKMTKIVTVGFEMEGNVTVTPDGMLKMVPDIVKAAGFPSKGLMDLLGIEVSDALKINENNGLKLDGNNLIMDPKKMFPPPAISGKIVASDINESRLSLTFDDGIKQPAPKLPDPTVQNYMYLTGGTVKIMNQTYTNANLCIADMDPSNPMDFFIRECKIHLKKGYTKLIDDKGTTVSFVPDYAKMMQGTVSTTPAKYKN